jgi:hypothetical protein
MRIKALILLLMFTAALLNAQTVRFNKSFGGGSEDQGRSVQQTFDKGYIVAGATSSMGSGNMDVYLIKTDSMGMHQWSKAIGGMNSEWGNSVVQLPDSGYAIAGYTNSFGAGGYDMYLIRTNKTGDTLWTKTYGGNDWDFSYSIKQTSDGGFILAGTTASFGAGNDDIYLVKTDANGDTLWTKTYGGAGDDDGRSVWQNTDGGYFINGFTSSLGNGEDDIFYIRTDAAGIVSWQKALGGTLTEQSFEGQQTNDGGFILAGYTNSFAPHDEAYIIKTDVNGDTLWTTRNGAPNNARAYSVQEVTGLGFVWTGYLELAGSKEMYIFRIDMQGYYLFSTTHGNYTGEDIGYSVRFTNDLCYILTGVTESFGNGLGEVYLVKTDYNGYTLPYNSINDKSELQELSISPNPMITSSVLMLPRGLPPQQLSLSISDITGRQVQQRVLDANERSVMIEREQLKTGIYFFSLYDKAGRKVAAGKIIVQQ